MKRLLCLSVQYLDSRFHGQNARGAEWPPSPMRLFQALLAGSRNGSRALQWSPDAIAAFAWLEDRLPPWIRAPQRREATVYTLYVPHNQSDRAIDRQNRLTSKVVLSSTFSGGDTIYFIWPLRDDEWPSCEAAANLICRKARHLTVLGTGLDIVVGDGRVLTGDQVRALSGELWRPVPGNVSGRNVLHVPAKGSLASLEHSHEVTLRDRSIGMRAESAVFAGATYVRTSIDVPDDSLPPEVSERLVHAFSLVGADRETKSFDPRCTIEVAAWLRHSAHMAAQKLKLDAPFVEGFVCGHGEGAEGKSARFSYLPLPTLSPKGRDGRIRRVLLTEPFGAGEARALAVARRLAGAPLIDERTGEVRAELRAMAGDDGVFRRYLPKRGATTWGTVTPIVLPGRDDRRSRKAVGLVLKALAQAGYTTPVEEITLQREPVFPGAEMADRYRVPEYLKPYPLTHAIIVFSELVQGPIVSGGGRHIGLGVFASLD